MPTRVLVADDHGIVRDGLRSILGVVEDIEVIAIASDGGEAVAKTMDLVPDVVVMDVSMPRLNGIEATRQLRAQMTDTEVLMLSMHAARDVIMRAFAAGARGYMLKDSISDELIRGVKTVAQGKRFLGKGVAEQIGSGFNEEFGADVLAGLTHPERQILQLIAEGKSNAEAAAILHLSIRTVEAYRSRIMRQLGLKNLPSLVKFAIRHGIIPLV
jgi:DNA-binding NarL/FixJ family response regulator